MDRSEPPSLFPQCAPVTRMRSAHLALRVGDSDELRTSDSECGSKRNASLGAPPPPGSPHPSESESRRTAPLGLPGSESRSGSGLQVGRRPALPLVTVAESAVIKDSEERPGTQATASHPNSAKARPSPSRLAGCATGSRPRPPRPLRCAAREAKQASRSALRRAATRTWGSDCEPPGPGGAGSALGVGSDGDADTSQPAGSISRLRAASPSPLLLRGRAGSLVAGVGDAGVAVGAVAAEVTAAGALLQVPPRPHRVARARIHVPAARAYRKDEFTRG